MATIARRNVIVEFSADTRQFNRAAGQVEREVSGLQRVFQNAASTFAGLFAFDVAGRISSGINEIAQSTVRLAIDAEQTQVAFETFLGSAEKASKLIAELNKFSEVTPFEPTQVISAGQALLAFGVQADEVTSSLEAIGNIAAGTGTDFNELAQIFGKAKVQGRLFGEDINQLTGRGIPIIAEFAKQFDVAQEEVKQLVTDGKIGFPELEKAFVSLTSEGGRFFDLMNKQSQTVGGRISTLKGNFDALLRTIGERLLPTVGRLVDFFNGLVTAAKDFVAVPVSEELEKERIELNALVAQITDANVSQERRNELIAELQQKYPDYLKNLDAESVTNKQISDRLKEVNRQLVANILLQRKREEVNRALQEQADAITVTQEAIAAADLQVIQRLQQVNLTRQEGQKITAEGLQQDIIADKDNLERADRFRKIARERFGLELDFLNNTIERRIFNLQLSEIESANLFKRFQEIIKARQAEEAATKTAINLQKELNDAQAEFDKQFGKTEEIKEMAAERDAGLSKEEKKRLEKEAKEREKLAIDLSKSQQKLKKEADDKDKEIEKERAEEVKKREELEILAAETRFALSIKNFDDQIQLEKDITAAKKEALDQRIKDIEDSNNADLELKLKLELEKLKLEQNSSDKIAQLEQDKLDEIKRLRDEAQQKDREREEDEPEPIDPEEAAKEIAEATIEATQTVISALQDANEERIRLIDERIEKQKESVEAAKKIALEGNVELLELEEQRLDELESRREEATRRQQRLAAIEIAIQQAVAVANSVAAVAKAFNLPPPFGLITGVATSIALAGQVAAAIIAINSSFGNIGAFAEGTDFFDGEGGPKSDSNLAFISRGERIVPADKNNKYFSTLNEFQRGTPMADMLHNIAQGGPVVSQQPGRASAGYEMGRLEKEMAGIRKLLSKGNTSITLDKDGFSVHMQRYRMKKERLRKRIG